MHYFAIYTSIDVLCTGTVRENQRVCTISCHHCAYGYAPFLRNIGEYGRGDIELTEVAKDASPDASPSALQIVVSPAAQTLEKKEAEFAALAEQLGYSFLPTKKLLRMLGESLARRLVHRSGYYVYQSIAFSIPNSDIRTAQKLFQEDCLKTDTQPSCRTWKLSTFEDMEQAFSPVICMSGYACAGLTRALQEPLERVVRVVAIFLPGRAEVSHVTYPRGVDRLYVNSEYALADETGEIHPSKNSSRQEKVIEDEQGLRERLYLDLQKLFEQGVPLAPGFLRAIGQHARADELQARLLNQSSAMQAGQSKQEAVQQRDWFEVESISGEKMIGGHMYYLVRWAGYHATWELWRMPGHGAVGDPVESWEPWANVVDTEALVVWEATPH